MDFASVAFDTPDLLPKVLIPASAGLAILFAIILTTRTAQIKVKRSSAGGVRTENGREYLLSVRHQRDRPGFCRPIHGGLPVSIVGYPVSI